MSLCAAMSIIYLHANFAGMPTTFTCTKVQKTCFFRAYFGPKISFFAIANQKSFQNVTFNQFYGQKYV